MWTYLTMIETAPCVLTVKSALLVLDGSGQSCNGHEGAHECKFFDFRRMLEKPEFAQAVPFSERNWRSYRLHSVRNGKRKKLVILVIQSLQHAVLKEMFCCSLTSHTPARLATPDGRQLP